MVLANLRPLDYGVGRVAKIAAIRYRTRYIEPFSQSTIKWLGTTFKDIGSMDKFERNELSTSSKIPPWLMVFNRTLLVKISPCAPQCL